MILNASPTSMNSSSPKLYRRRSDAFDASDRFARFFEKQGDPLSSSQRSTMTSRESGVSCDVSFFQRKPHSKSVHFSSTSLTQLIVLSDEDDSVEESSSHWYGEDDIRRFRKEFVDHARNVARFNRKGISKSCKSTILTVFQECIKGNLVATTAELNDADNEIKSSDGMTSFESFCGDTQVGLERMSARQIACDKSKRRILLARTILKMQSQKSSVDEDDLRIACERISRPSRLFAIHIAQSSAQEA